MARYEITISKVFCASHALRLPDGTLEPVHGHNWPVEVTVGSDRLDALETVMDFHDLEAAVDAVIAPWQNRDLNQCPPFVQGDGDGWNPSAERVAEWIADRVSESLPGPVRLLSVRVGEAPGCFATVRLSS